eukprot:1737122-Rhodomonas_salina.1
MLPCLLVCKGRDAGGIRCSGAELRGRGGGRRNMEAFGHVTLGGGALRLPACPAPVSYTHLTLPTICSV